MEVAFVSENRGRLSLFGGGRYDKENHVPDRKSRVSPNTWVVVGEKTGEFQSGSRKIIFRKCRPIYPEEIVGWNFTFLGGDRPPLQDAIVEFLGLEGKDARLKITYCLGRFSENPMQAEPVEVILPADIVREPNVENPGITSHRVWLKDEWKGFRRGKESWNQTIMFSVWVKDDLLEQWRAFCLPFQLVKKKEWQDHYRMKEEKKAIAVANFFEDHPELLPVGIQPTWDMMFDIAIKNGFAEHRSSSGYWGGKRDDTWRQGASWCILIIRGEEFTRG